MSRAPRPSPGEVTLFGREPAHAQALKQKPKAVADSGEHPPRKTAGNFAHVALNRPIDCEFTYRIPPQLVASVQLGIRVAVPFGTSREVGVVTGLSSESDLHPKRLRDVARVLDPKPLVSAELQSLARWISERYACSFGEALHAALPAALKRESGRRRTRTIRASGPVAADVMAELATKREKQHRLLRTLLEIGAPVELGELLRRMNLSEAPAKSLVECGLAVIESVEKDQDELESASSERPRPAALSDEQETAVEALNAALETRKHATFLLEGVTGSGKTEVYLAAIERALELGRGAIVLVPEIALTPQTVGWFRSRFKDVAVLHSKMSDAQRFSMWQRLRRREARVVVGARSAIFAPVPDLGIVVVDEEHEPSFKQGNVPRYHARDVAVEVARGHGAVCVLGSATPSLESWHQARSGRYEHLRLRARVGGKPMPQVEIVDLRNEGARGAKLFSERLKFLVLRGLERGEQSILFQNRRGFAPVLWCAGCKSTLRCGECDVSLTWHQRIARLVCHSCCEERVRPRVCPYCSAPDLRYLGAGSERIEDEIKLLAPTARVLRMDSDTMRRREDYEAALSAFGRGEIDILVGTQMIAKGLDFPRVTLVGVVSADAGLHLPDFRASERTFQLIAQVAGRAGRGLVPGQIVVQTLSPEHPAIQRAAEHDFQGFAAAEDELRRELGYPPHGRLVRIVFEDEELDRVQKSAERMVETLQADFDRAEIIALGPAPAPIAMARGRHRYHVLLKSGPQCPLLSEILAKVRVFAAAEARPKIAIDVDPVSML
ncbi:MAG TPA: primosomal protein N' [Planctomycetota bacterium]|nr:primosomal protein N' [Planctomycetota bacterium]